MATNSYRKPVVHFESGAKTSCSRAIWNISVTKNNGEITCKLCLRSVFGMAVEKQGIEPRFKTIIERIENRIIVLKDSLAVNEELLKNYKEELIK